MAARKKFKIEFAFLADSHKQTNGKIDAFGMFNQFYVWDRHATRSCSLVMGLERPSGVDVERLDVFIVGPTSKVKVVGEIGLVNPVAPNAAMAATPISFDLDALGPHRLGVREAGAVSSKPYFVNFTVTQRAWVELPTGDKLKQILADPQAIKSGRAQLKCMGCDRVYTFELHVDPEVKLPRGSRAFPPAGKFVCPKCKKTHFLKDVEGQIRAHLTGQAGEASNAV